MKPNGLGGMSPRLSWVLWLFLAGWMAWQVPAILQVHLTDFDHYYTAAERLRNGANIYFDENAVWSRQEIPTWYLYPPYLAGLLTPFTFLGRRGARMVFLGITMAALVGIDFYLIRLLRRFRRRSFSVEMLIHLLVFLPYPTRLLLGSLQIEGVLFLGFVAVVEWIFQGNRIKSITTAFLSGVMVKLWPAPYFVSLVTIFRWRFVVTGMVVGFIFMSIGTLCVGIEPQWYFLRYILSPLLSYVDFYIDNQSAAACIGRLLPGAVPVYAYFRWAVLTAYLYSTYRSRISLAQREVRSVACNASLFVAVSMLLSPTAWTAAHIRLLLPLTVGCAFLLEYGSQRLWLVIAHSLSLLLYCLPQGWISERPFLVLFGDYPLLLATLIQFVVFLRLSGEMGRSSLENETEHSSGLPRSETTVAEVAVGP